MLVMADQTRKSVAHDVDDPEFGPEDFEGTFGHAFVGWPFRIRGGGVTAELVRLRLPVVSEVPGAADAAALKKLLEHDSI